LNHDVSISASCQPIDRFPAGTYPDLHFIKKRISVVQIARELGLNVFGSTGQCWRPENHRNADRNPSVHFHSKKNIGRCFVCDPHAWSNIDLVMMILGISTREAVNWIARRFTVPNIPKGKHISRRESTDVSRVGTSGFPLEDVVRSGFWASLTACEAKAFVVLLTFTESATSLARISYRGIMRYAGIHSPNTVSRTLQRFRNMHLVEIRRSTDGAGFRGTSSYLLTLDDPTFRAMLRQIDSRHRAEIDIERQYRAEQRRKSRLNRAHLYR
jgi:hypothetical protein